MAKFCSECGIATLPAAFETMSSNQDQSNFSVQVQPSVLKQDFSNASTFQHRVYDVDVELRVGRPLSDGRYTLGAILPDSTAFNQIMV